MACCLLIVLFVRDELSYDTYHEKAEEIHRLIRARSAYTAAPMGPALAAEISGVTHAARIQAFEEVLVHDGGEMQFVETVYAADTSLFDIFSFTLVRGNPETVLSRPDALILTESAAAKYFGQEDPLGKVLIMEDGDSFPLTVTGVLQDLPTHSHFRFDLLVSFKLVEATSNRLENWSTNWLFTYLLFEKGIEAAQVQAQLPAFFERHTGEAKPEYRIQPLLDIHLKSAGLEMDIAPQGNMAYVLIFSAVAGLLLLIACINFMNLATAQSAQRSREVGMRKVLGARRQQLVGQFLGESMVMAFVALVLALGLVALFLPGFEALVEKELSLPFAEAGMMVGALVGLTLIVGLIAGSYPAFFLAGFKPISSLKGKRIVSSGGGLRKGLVVFQFAISTFLIVGTLVIARQLDYVKNMRLGFDKEQVVVLPFGTGLDSAHERVKANLMQHAGVRSVSASGNVPGQGVSDFFYRLEGHSSTTNELPGWDTYFVDEAFIETMALDVVEGRGFSEEIASDEQAFILNETAVAWARATLGEGWETPIGKELEFYVPGAEGWRVFNRGRVVGVVKDFHYRSLREEIGPLVLQMLPGAFGNVLVKVSTDDLSGTLAFLEEQWSTLRPGQPFDYYFLDQSYDQLYRAEERVGNLLSSLAGLTILIACMGLFGLAAFMAEQRTKEIGIRKVLGASVPGIVGLLSKSFVKLVAVAFLVGAPVAYFIMDQWLTGFAYRVSISGWIFLIAGAAALGIAFLSVSYQSIRAAIADPVRALRYE